MLLAATGLLLALAGRAFIFLLDQKTKQKKSRLAQLCRYGDAPVHGAWPRPPYPQSPSQWLGPAGSVLSVLSCNAPPLPSPPNLHRPFCPDRISVWKWNSRVPGYIKRWVCPACTSVTVLPSSTVLLWEVPGLEGYGSSEQQSMCSTILYWQHTKRIGEAERLQFYASLSPARRAASR